MTDSNELMFWYMRVWTYRDRNGVDHLLDITKKLDAKSYGILHCTGEIAYYNAFQEHGRTANEAHPLILFTYYDPDEEHSQFPICEYQENLCELCARLELMWELSS